MAAKRHASASINQNVFICVLVSLLLPTAYEGATRMYDDGAGDGRRLTREYHLRQGALRGLIVRPSRNYDLQNVEMFLGIPYAAPPVGNLRFMPPVTAPPWPGLKMATHFAPVCPQMLPPIKKGNPPSLGRQQYLNRLKPFLSHESEDCLYLNIYVPYREQKSKKFPIVVFIHGDSFEWSSGNPYDGRVLAAYGNIMVITINFRLGILGFLKPSLTEHDYGNNGLLDQLAALQWIKDNIEDLNGDPHSVTLMGHGTGAACVSFLMLSPISNGFFHRAILMSGSALSDWAMTKDPTQYTLQVVQSLGCHPNTKNMLSCLQNKTLSDIKKVQILSREFETPLGPIVAGAFVPNEPAKTIEAFPNLLSKYQLLSGVTELERYHDFGVIELDHGILENQRDDFITKYAKVVFDGAENIALKEILKEYSLSSLDPQRWSVETNRDVILTLMSDARTLAPQLVFADYHSKANGRSYFYVFGHNSISTEYAPLNKSVNGEELPYVLGIPLGGTDTHFHSEYTQKEKLLSEVVMRLWTNFVKIGTPNTQSVNEYYTLDKKQWSRYNVDWPEYNIAHQSFLRLDIPPHISSLYRSNYTRFWSETLPNKLRRFVSDPLFEIAPPAPSVARPRTTHRNAATTDHSKRLWQPQVESPIRSNPTNPTNFGHVRPYSPQRVPDTEAIYRELQLIKTPSRPFPTGLLDKTNIPHLYSTTVKPKTSTSAPAKTSSATVTLIVSLGTLFLAVNVGICAVLYFKKRRLQLRERALETTRRSRAELGEVDVIGHKSSKEDKGALQTLKNGCSVIKSMSFNRIRGSSQKSKKKSELCKTPKSDDSGGFRERFQLRRHLSTSTLDAHTKVRDWITNEVMHRCSPGILRKSNSEINNDKHMNVVKPFTRSEELLSDSKKSKKDTLKVNDALESKGGTSKRKTKTSEKTTSTSALGSHSSIGSAKQSLNSIKHSGKSTDSLKSKGTDSIKSKKVSVAIDATPSARTNSILKQEPIEISKSFDGEAKHSIRDKLAKAIKENKGLDVIETAPPLKHDSQTFTNVVTLSFGQEKPLKISHKHSTSDPVTDVNYDKLKQKTESKLTNILPPVTFRNDINVTSRDEAIQAQPLSAEEALLTIKRRNFPKVLPDLPRDQRRLSLQPNSLQTFRGEGSIDSPFDRPKLPPQPPPRTTTLERRLAYKNTKPLSSFDVANVKIIPEKDCFSRNYENISSLSPDTNKLNRSFETSISDKSFPLLSNEREYPRVIIASNDIPTKTEPKIVIKASSSQAEIPSNIPRVTLPEDFHSNTGSYTSFSSFYSDDDISEFPDDLAEDKLLQELVGGVDSPTDMDVLDSKGPETIFEKKLEIVPVKVNPGSFVPKSAEDYICVSDLFLPDVSTLENTAKIKPNFGLNKLQRRSESIHKPPEKAIKVKNKRGIKSATILNRNKSKSSDKCKGDDGNKLEHSNSGSSNDTETSTGTVREVNKNVAN